MFPIKSSSSDKALVFHSLQRDSFIVELQGLKTRVTNQVYARSTDGLVEFWDDLAEQERPWSGARAWNSPEGDMSLSLTCSATGTLIMTVGLSGMLGTDEEWTMTAGITLELGQLPGIAEQTRQFFQEA